MKLIKTTEAEGHILCHDITGIIAGRKKDAVFRKGHIVKRRISPYFCRWARKTFISGNTKRVCSMRMKLPRYFAEPALMIICPVPSLKKEK